MAYQHEIPEYIENRKPLRDAVFVGMPEGTRTPDQWLRRPLLYPLSYWHKSCADTLFCAISLYRQSFSHVNEAALESAHEPAN
jgi:hypothetical protein